MTFSELKTKVTDWMNRTDLDSVVGDFINLAIHKTEREANFNCMMKIETGTITTDLIPAPTNYQQVKSLMTTVNSQQIYMNKLTYPALLASYPYGSTSTGSPEAFAYKPSASTLVIRPYPDTSYDYELVYWATTQDLTADSDTNWWLLNAWELIMYGALTEACNYISDDERMVMWKQRYTETLSEFIRNEQDEEFSGIQSVTSDYVGG